MKKSVAAGINICLPKQISQRRCLGQDGRGTEHSKQSVNTPALCTEIPHQSLFAGEECDG